MPDQETILKAVHAVLEHERGINLHRYPIKTDYLEETLTLKGK